MYTFLRIQTHQKCPNAQGWYLLLDPNNNELVMLIHARLTRSLYLRYGTDPHHFANTGYSKDTLDELQKTLPKDILGYQYHPVVAGTKWLSKMITMQEPICVNAVGGWMLYDGAIVLAKQESEWLIFPEYFDDEIITISRWPQAAHFYLSSNRGRLFDTDKTNTLERAIEIAEDFVPKNRIKVK